MSGIGILAKLKGAISGKGPELVKELGNGLDKIFSSKEEMGILENKKSEIELLFQEKVMLHDEKLTELALEETKVYLADTQDARSTNVQIQESEKASWLAKNIAYCIDIAIVGTWMFLTIYLLCVMLSLVKKDATVDYTAVTAVWGGVGAYASTIINFHRGTSISSKNNGDVIRKIANNK